MCYLIEDNLSKLE